jgi:hypothetical protein
MAQTSRSRGFIGQVRRLFAARPEGVSSLSASAAPAATASPQVSVDPRIAVLVAEWQQIRESSRRGGSERLARLAGCLVANAVIAGPYLTLGAAAAGRLGRWALPGLGLVAGLELLALEYGALASARVLERRARQIETALEALLAPVGRIRPLGLATEGFAQAEQVGAWAAAALYGVLVLGWLAALFATTLGWIPAGAVR